MNLFQTKNNRTLALPCKDTTPNRQLVVEQLRVGHIKFVEVMYDVEQEKMSGMVAVDPYGGLFQ